MNKDINKIKNIHPKFKLTNGQMKSLTDFWYGQ